MDKVLFTITAENLETGLRGYPCGYCTTSYVDPHKGLFYRGLPVSSLSHSKPEEVMSLLYFGQEPSKEEKNWFLQELSARSDLSAGVVNAIQSLPRKGHPMKLFSAAMLILGMLEGTGDYEEDCLQVVAKVPALAAVVINHHAGWGKTDLSVRGLEYMERFTHLINVPNKRLDELRKGLELFNVLHYDHGGGNLSAFVGKAVASGLEDMYGSLCAALCALAGSRHGRANQDALQFVKDIQKELGQEPSEENLQRLISTKLKEGELIFGFGHAVLRTEDPRATALYEYVNTYYGDDPLVKLAQMIRRVGTKVLEQEEKITCPYPNVDAISGVLLSVAGFPHPQYFTVLFGVARCVGIAIQIVYERVRAREGKGTPIVRPSYPYKGST